MSHGVKIWDEWADEDGDLGHIYGYQWRSWPRPDGSHLDQITQLIQDIKTSPGFPAADRQRLECRRDR